MNQDRRNPYVILGIPYGATPAEARSGFARASRRSRRSDGSDYSIEDLTWALHQIEQTLEEPELAVHMYRLPADPSALQTEETGCFNPAPHRMERQTPETTPSDKSAVRRAAVAHHLADLLRSRAQSEPVPMPYQLTEE